MRVHSSFWRSGTLEILKFTTLTHAYALIHSSMAGWEIFKIAKTCIRSSYPLVWILAKCTKKSPFRIDISCIPLWAERWIQLKVLQVDWVGGKINSSRRTTCWNLKFEISEILMRARNACTVILEWATLAHIFSFWLISSDATIFAIMAVAWIASLGLQKASLRIGLCDWFIGSLSCLSRRNMLLLWRRSLLLRSAWGRHIARLTNRKFEVTLWWNWSSVLVDLNGVSEIVLLVYDDLALPSILLILLKTPLSWIWCVCETNLRSRGN